MYLMYLDESGNTGTDYDNKQQPIFVLGGFTIKIKLSSHFENNEIHANEIFSPSHNSFFHIKQWLKNLELLNNLVDLILGLDINFRYIAIDKKDFKAALQQRVSNYIKIDPYIYAFCTLYQYMSEYFKKNNEKGIIFLDEILNIPKYLNVIYPELSLNDTSIIEQALFLKSKDTNFIQIADIYSFYVCQYLNIKKGYKKYSDLKTNHCINNYNKLFTKTTLIDHEFSATFISNPLNKNGQGA